MELLRDKIIKEKVLNSSLFEMFEMGKLRRNHPLQRYSDLWDSTYRDGFIATVIKGEDFDSIKICEQITDKGIVLWLIDGLQRLSTIDQYRHNFFRLGTKIELPIVKYQVAKRDANEEIITDEDGVPEYEIREFDLRKKTYDDLPRELQMQFDNCEINVVKHLDCSDDEVAYHIRRYNHQRAMNANQTSVTYAEGCAAYIKDISQNSRFFLDCGRYTEAEKKNGVWERIVMECIMSIFHLEDWQKQSKKMGAYIKDHADKEEFDTLRNYLSRLEVLIPEGWYTDLFNSKNTFIWLAVFDRFTKLGLDDNKFLDFLVSFEATLSKQVLDGESFVEIDQTRATKDRSVVIHKITFLEKLMKNYFGISESETVLPDMEEMEQFIAENLGIDIATIHENMPLYIDSLGSYKDYTIRVDSVLSEPDNEPSLLAMVAYSYLNDVDIDEWLGEYAESHNSYNKDQAANYQDMLNDFLSYINNEQKTA